MTAPSDPIHDVGFESSGSSPQTLSPRVVDDAVRHQRTAGVQVRLTERLGGRLAKKVYAVATAGILMGVVVMAWLKPFGDGQRGEYLFVGGAALVALAKTAFESLRWHFKWRRLLRESSP